MNVRERGGTREDTVQLGLNSICHRVVSFITLNFCHFSNCHLLNSLALVVVVVVKTFCQIVMVQLLSHPPAFLFPHCIMCKANIKSKSASEFINPRKKTNKYENNFDLSLEGIMRSGEKEGEGDLAMRVVH